MLEWKVSMKSIWDKDFISRKVLIDILYELIGSILTSVALYNFAYNQKFPMTGFSGISVILKRLFDIPLGVSISILIYVCMFNFNNCVTYLINGLNKIKIQIITSILGTIIYLIAVCFFIKGTYGIYGISISMCVIYTLMSLVHLYQCNLLAKNKAHGIWNE